MSQTKQDRDGYWVSVSTYNNEHRKHIDKDCPSLRKTDKQTWKPANVIRDYPICKMCTGQDYGTGENDQDFEFVCPLCGESGVGMLPSHLPECDGPMGDGDK